jgi:divalent metal cation (Fe/Co/Zn/Cd) transporter
MTNRSFLTRFARFSIAAAILTIGLKTVAYLLTGSVGLLSDALESLVNLVGALTVLAMLTIAARRRMTTTHKATARRSTFRAVSKVR